MLGRYGVKERNAEGPMVLDFEKRMEMAVVNMCTKKKVEHEVTYKSGGRSNWKAIGDCKVES